MTLPCENWVLHQISDVSGVCDVCGADTSPILVVKEPFRLDLASICKGCARKVYKTAWKTYNQLRKAEEAMSNGDYIPIPSKHIQNIVLPSICLRTMDIVRAVSPKEAPTAAQEWAKFRVWKTAIQNLHRGSDAHEQWLSSVLEDHAKCLCEKPTRIRFSSRGRYKICANVHLGCGMVVLQRKFIPPKTKVPK